ncbi:hypothetical protein Dimus_023736 [Dionaea muscipula]
MMFFWCRHGGSLAGHESFLGGGSVHASIAAYIVKDLFPVSLPCCMELLDFFVRSVVKGQSASLQQCDCLVSCTFCVCGFFLAPFLCCEIVGNSLGLLVMK